MSEVISLLVRRSGLREADVRRIIEDAPNRYKVYYIKKRSGGLRQIAQPSPEVKFLQRVFVENYLCGLPIHPAATAYRRGLSLTANVLPHREAGPILKLDFKDFFPSIKARDWHRYCQDKSILMHSDDAYLSERLLFFRDKSERSLRLSIGAPSSPIVSNIVMYRFDQDVTDMMANDRVVYTRYADDMTFSAPRTGYMVRVERHVTYILRRMQYPVLYLNKEKTTVITKRYRRSVTGLVLSNDGRVTIGRERKRLISASVHRAITSGMSPGELAKLSGLLAFANGVEPSFLDALRAKYGAGQVDRILHSSPEQKKAARHLK